MKETDNIGLIWILIIGLVFGLQIPLKGENLQNPENAVGALSTAELEDAVDVKSDKLADEKKWPWDDWSARQKVIGLNLAVWGGIVGVGAISWDYGSSSFHFQNEGWFAQDTKYGGSDKLGHAFSAYALTSLYNTVYRLWGLSEEEASLGGALSSWSQMTLMEFGDGFSKRHGFSWEDEVMDTVGVAFGYLRNRFPSLKEKVDFRLEWIPSPSFRHCERMDVFTDYSGQKCLLAFKPAGFFKTENPLIHALEIQVGYYTRGFVDNDEEYFHGQHRFTYVGVGLNVTYLLDKLTGHRAWGVFDYIQVPYTYLSETDRHN